jgi:hypothetical protein
MKTEAPLLQDRQFAARTRARSAATVLTALAEPMDAHTLTRLALVDPDELADELRVPLIQAWERADSWLQARKQRALAAVVEATTRTNSSRDGDHARFEIGAALRLSPNTAADRTWVADRLTNRLPATLAALEAGDISYWQAHTLVHAVAELPDDVAAAVEATVLGRAPEQSLADTKRTIARAVITADPAGAAARATERARDRCVQRDPGYDGNAMLTAIGPAAAIDTIYTALTATALRLKTERRRTADGDPSQQGDPADLRMDACRFDALESMCATMLADSRLPTHQHSRPAVHVAVDLPTLLGLADHPAELLGHGPIPPAIARALAADGDWQRFVTDPLTAELLDLGSETYRPGPALSRFVTARDRTCSFPHCNAPATRCDLDHLDDFDRGGRTSRANLAPHCRQHHNAKTHHDWRVRRTDDGGIEWTSPLGQSYLVPATRHPGVAAGMNSAVDGDIGGEGDDDPPDDG